MREDSIHGTGSDACDGPTRTRIRASREHIHSLISGGQAGCFEFTHVALTVGSLVTVSLRART